MSPAEQDRENALDFEIEVKGKAVAVHYLPDSFLQASHLEFRTETPGPISHTGYRSFFLQKHDREELEAELGSPIAVAYYIADKLAAEYKEPAPTQLTLI